MKVTILVDKWFYKLYVVLSLKGTMQVIWKCTKTQIYLIVSCVRVMKVTQSWLTLCNPVDWYWSGYPFPSPVDLPNPGIEPRSRTLQADSLPAEPQGKPYCTAQGNSGQCHVATGWEAMLREKGYMYIYGWIPLPSLKVITMLLISYAVIQNKKFIKIIENKN